MIRKSMLMIALSGLLLVGCTGESTDEISAKDRVIILHDVGVTGCTFLEHYGNSELESQDLVKNVGYSSKDNSVSCQKYGKTGGYLASYDDIDADIDIECAEITLDDIQEALPEEDLSIFENKDKACVLSFDIN